MKEFIRNTLLSKISLVTVLAILLTGCASVSVKSVKDSSYDKSIHKLFVILNHTQVDNVDPNYTPYLLKALHDEFEKEKIEVSLNVIRPLSLSNQSFDSEIANYKPDGILTILANGGVSSGGGGLLSIYYDVSVFDAPTEKRIWRARIDASGGTAIREKRMAIMAQKLVHHLKEEKLISSKPNKVRAAI